MGKTSGQVSWGLADRDDKEIFAWAWKFEDFGGPSSAFTEAEGFPTFLRLATQAIVAKRAKANKPKAPSPSAARPDSNAKPSARHGRIIVAVFDVQDLSGRLERNVLEQLTEYLAAQLVEQGSYRVVPRGQIRNRLAEEKAESMSACFDEACQIELGKAVAAEKSLQTRVLRVGTICAVTSTLYDLRTETSERASTVEGDCSEDTLVASVKELAKRLVQQ